MQIVFKRDIADQLKERYTVLELETFIVDGIALEAFCVVPAEKLAFTDLNELNINIAAHNVFLSALKNKDHDLCMAMHKDLLGKFGGELDSFYDAIAERIIKVKA